MDYSINQWDLQTLIDNYDKNQINLNPPYQRGDIWSASAKKKLIESIKLRYPLPLFFLYKNENNIYEMVDGQQRTRTIIGYAKGFFPDTDKKTIEQSDKHFFLHEYKIAICIIYKAAPGEIEDFYFRVNKFGTKLNRPEILKSQYANTALQNLVESIASSPQFTSLSIFSSTTLNRLADLDFIGELLTLIRYGITDKKITVDKFYNDLQFANKEAQEIERLFFDVLEDVIRFNEIYEINRTRYRQRNDLYTLFNFLINNRAIEKSTLDYQYKILVLIGEDISPSQEKCFAFREYAENCVSQSNSKKAREERLRFFNELLLNSNTSISFSGEPENTMEDVVQFYQITSAEMKNVEEFYLVDIQGLMNKTQRHLFL